MNIDIFLIDTDIPRCVAKRIGFIDPKTKKLSLLTQRNFDSTNWPHVS